LVHTITVTSANKHDITETANLIREDDEAVYGDSGYLGVQKRSEIQQNEHFSKSISELTVVQRVYPK